MVLKTPFKGLDKLSYGPKSPLVDLIRSHKGLKGLLGTWREGSYWPNKASYGPDEICYGTKKASYGPKQEELLYGPKRDLIMSHMYLKWPLIDLIKPNIYFQSSNCLGVKRDPPNSVISLLFRAKRSFSDQWFPRYIEKPLLALISLN